MRTRVGEELQALAPAFVSRRTGEAFLGYLSSQRQAFEKERPRTREQSSAHGYDTKYAMHALRIAHQGRELLTTGRITLPIAEPHRSRLMDIRGGEPTVAEIGSMLDEATAALARILDASRLPPQADADAIDSFLVGPTSRSGRRNEPELAGPMLRAMSERWATFDCYGTLVDWNAGIGAELARVLRNADRGHLLERYHAIEPRIQSEQPALGYRDVMAAVLGELAAEEGVELPAGERDALARSLPGWPVFPEVPAALAEAHGRGWKLVALSNSDRDLIDASLRAIGVPFEDAVVAGEIDSYKPAHRHWQVFYERSGADPDHHVHVAQSHFHDIAPAAELGIPSIWINRLGETAAPAPQREQRDLTGLADALDELCPPAR